MNVCPNCGYRHANDDYAPELMKLRIQNKHREILLRLSQAQGGWVTTESIINFLYGDDIDGGPQNARACAQIHISHTKREIVHHGWTIESERHRGYRLVRTMGRPVTAPKHSGYIAVVHP